MPALYRGPWLRRNGISDSSSTVGGLGDVLLHLSMLLDAFELV